MNKCSKCGKEFTPTQKVIYEDECPNCHPPKEVKVTPFFVLKGKGLCGKTYKTNSKKDYSWCDDIVKESEKELM